MPDVVIDWNLGAVERWADTDAGIAAALDVVAGKLVLAMKAHAPVSPYMPESGRLRSSIRAARLAANEVIVGPTVDYAGYVVAGTEPHIIESTGPWPLRNPHTGQVFGRIVHHPGTRPNRFMLDALADVAGSVVIA